jgi:hypothetical protein
VAPSFSSWSFCDLDDWYTVLQNQFPGNRYFLPLLQAELDRRLAAMPLQPADPELEAMVAAAERSWSPQPSLINSIDWLV